MKILTYILTLVASLRMVAGFPTNAPSAGYSFVDAFHGLNTSDPYTPQFIGVRGTNLYWTSRDQKVALITNLSAPTRTLFLDNQSRAHAVLDCGLPSLIQHPTDPARWFSFGAEREVVFDGVTTVTNIWDTLREWRPLTNNPNRLAEHRILIRQLDRSAEHLGGAMVFGPDGYLYFTVSDEGGQGDPYRNSQRIDLNFFGGVMRIDVDGRPGNLPPNPHPAIQGQYWVPSDNPWVGATQFNGAALNPANVRTEFWMVGLRNPNTMQIDRPTGRIFIGDVGGALWESVQEVVRGANAGWAAMEGPWATTFPTGSTTAQRPPEGYRPPFWAYPHPNVVSNWPAQFQGNCIFVGPVVRGSRYPELDGCLIVSDASGGVWSINIDTRALTRIATHPTGATSWAIDPVTGDILAGSFWGKSIKRMVRALPSDLPATLSATGFFSDLQSLTPSGATPYEVADPFWSDGAVKTRWAKLAPGGKITRDASDVWSFPAGTVWVKHFDVDGRRTETRFTIKTQDGYYGLSYRWRADGSDADLASPYGEDVALPGRTWHIPGWADCTQCHTPLYGYAPGFRTAQLNVNGQLQALSAAGWFEHPITNAAALPALSRWDSQAPIQHRFKSYLDANCSHCHQPGGLGRGDWDARLTVPLSLSGIVGGQVSDTLGLPGAKVIAPGNLSDSILFRRVWDHDEHGLPNFHMPPLGTAVVNTNGASLVAEFVDWARERTVWQIGTNGPASEPYREFSVENRLKDPAPGKVTRLPGDPLMEVVNPAVDDDFYTAGEYPAGFNGLTGLLTVYSDEPSNAWERALTNADPINRLHFIGRAGTGTLIVGLNRGGGLTNGVSMPNPSHYLTITQRAPGLERTIWSGTVNSNLQLSVSFQMVDGPQTIEFNRTGPLAQGSSYWMTFDFIRVEKGPQ